MCKCGYGNVSLSGLVSEIVSYVLAKGDQGSQVGTISGRMNQSLTSVDMLL